MSASPRASDPEVTSWLVIRVAGLPVSVLPQLRVPESFAMVEALTESRAWLAAEGERLSAHLHDLIGTVHDAAVKPHLIGLRRAVYQVRPPTPAEWNPWIESVLPAATANGMRRWLERLSSWRTGHARLPQVLADESTRQRAALREVAADPGFRRGLWQASPALSEELDKWLADPRREPRRQVLFRLARYLSRAATKTSPYSTFTISGLGAWSETGKAVHLAAHAEPRGVLELHGFVREQLIRLLATQPPLWASLSVRLNPSITADGARLSFLGRMPTEPLVTMPVTPAIAVCLRLVEGGRARTLGELQARLAAADGGDDVAVTRFLRHLIKIGLLDTGPPAGDAACSLAELARWLNEQGGDELADPAGRLDQAHAYLSEPATVTDIADHRARQERLRGVLDDLVGRLGGTDTDGPVQRLAAQDTAVLTTAMGTCARSAWQPALGDLDGLRRWLALFSPSLPLRLALGELVGRRFGPHARLPFLLLHRAVQEELAAGGATGNELRQLLSPYPFLRTPAGSQFRGLRRLHVLQQEALRPFDQAAERDGVVWVDPAALTRTAAGWPGWVHPLQSLSCYVQPLPSASETMLVLNRAAAGYGWGRNRVRHLITLAGGEPPPDGAWMAGGDGPVLAELSGTYGSSLNDRLPAVPYGIDYPFATSNAPAPQRLPVSQLIVSLDPDQGTLRLFSAGLEAEVKALYLGLLTPALLPPAARLLVGTFGELSMGWPALVLVDPQSGLTAPGAVQRLPRVVAGRVVLRRASWLVPAAAVPARDAGEADAGYLLRLAAWRRELGLPSRCFVRVVPSSGGDQHPDWTGRTGSSKARKPLYLDFASWLLVLGFENLLRAPIAAVVFEEALPDPEAAVEPAGDPRVAELLIEVSGRDGGGG